MKKNVACLTALLAAGLWLSGVGNARAADREGGARVDVDHSGIHVDTGNKDSKGYSTATAVKARDLIGVKVYNPSNENLGKIEDLVMDPSAGKIRYAVLSFGGFLGMGDKLFAVPWDDLKLVSKGTTSAGTTKEDYYVLDVSKDALKNAPGFDKSSWPDFANRNWSADIDKFYSANRSSTTRR
jgi:sporulation protein YlmC with PRC-barrel domain